MCFAEIEPWVERKEKEEKRKEKEEEKEKEKEEKETIWLNGWNMYVILT